MTNKKEKSLESPNHFFDFKSNKKTMPAQFYNILTFISEEKQSGLKYAILAIFGITYKSANYKSRDLKKQFSC